MKILTLVPRRIFFSFHIFNQTSWGETNVSWLVSTLRVEGRQGLCLEELLWVSTAKTCKATFLNVKIALARYLWITSESMHAISVVVAFESLPALFQKSLRRSLFNFFTNKFYRDLFPDTAVFDVDKHHLLTSAFTFGMLLVARTTKRAQTLYDGQPTSPPGVCHIGMAEPFCNRTREVSRNAFIPRLAAGLWILPNWIFINGATNFYDSVIH